MLDARNLGAPLAARIVRPRRVVSGLMGHGAVVEVHPERPHSAMLLDSLGVEAVGLNRVPQSFHHRGEADRFPKKCNCDGEDAKHGVPKASDRERFKVTSDGC